MKVEIEILVGRPKEISTEVRQIPTAWVWLAEFYEEPKVPSPWLHTLFPVIKILV